MTKSERKTKRRRSPALLAGTVLIFLMIVLLVTWAMFTSFDAVSNRFESGKIKISLLEPEWNSEKGDKVVPNKDIPKDPLVRNDEELDVYVFLKVTVPYDRMTVEKNDFVTQGNIDSDQAGTKDFTAEMPYYKFVVKEDETAQGSAISFVYDQNHDSRQRVYSSRWKLIDAPGMNEGEGQSHLINVNDTTGKTYTYLYAYMDADDNTKMYPLTPGESTHKLFDKIHVVNFREILDNEAPDDDEDFPTYNRDYGIAVEAYGIQSNYLAHNNETTDDPNEVWSILTQTNSD